MNDITSWIWLMMGAIGVIIGFRRTNENIELNRKLLEYETLIEHFKDIITKQGKL